MASGSNRHPSGFQDVRLGRNNNTITSAEYGNMKDVASMRARLTALSATTYTPARLDLMTVNDMIYALRQSGDAAGIK